MTGDSDLPKSARLPELLLAIAFFGGMAYSLQPQLLPTARQRAELQVLTDLHGRHARIVEEAEALLSQAPDHPAYIALAAEAAAVRSQNHRAMELYRKLPRDGGRWEFLAEYGLARRAHVLGQVQAAERHLRRCLSLWPDHLDANHRLGHLLQVEGRTWEAESVFFGQILRGKCRGDELLGAATTERYFRAEDRLERLSQTTTPPDPSMRLAEARRLIFSNRTAEAERLLRSVIDVRSDLGEAQGRLGRIIYDRADAVEFIQWRGSLADEARNHPEVWFVQGLQARRLGQVRGAVYCFLKTLERSPNHLGANLQIAGALEQVGLAEAAQEFSRRGELLAKLDGWLNRLRSDADEKLMEQVAGVLGELGRYWEAAGWSYVTTQMDVPQEVPRRELRRWLALARGTVTPNAPKLLPARLLSLHDFDPPRWQGSSPAAAREPMAVVDPSYWAITDDAEKLGIRLTYYEGTTETNRLEHIFNVMGGGLGVIDYDLDGWPDLYFAQANNWRNPAPQPENVDRLLRNAQGNPFQDVTADAGLGDMDFSHGVTVGDFDQDGFADLHVGNKGPNRLYRNQGDGTFADVTNASGVGGGEWSTSGVFADFSGDGLPDLYVLNYSLLDEATRKECYKSSGELMACTPGVLTAEFDRCYLNLGDGRFRDISETCGIRVPNGRGLGVVVWDYFGDGRLGLFIANDTSQNFFFVNQGVDSTGAPIFVEESVVRGVAFDAEGKAQASMGVAAGDLDHNGQLDLFVTTFENESKTLFSLGSDGFFQDLTRKYELRDSGFSMLGFGSQFADLNGDGFEDLIVTNGHVDQATSGNDRLPTQVFRNESGRRFVEVPAEKLGPFFARRHLGRGLARLDWNRDGRSDVAISHLHEPAALLTNLGRTPGMHPLVIRLIGRRGCREPTGATVVVKSAAWESKRLQTAGDGFLVTNERKMAFCVPDNNALVHIAVRWPGGNSQVWEECPGDGEVLLIEGDPRVFPQ